ncbi:MAG: hypothetical protein KBF73_01685 [Flavobacteriales bacterium]|nr:hypothetical protein [Flavobacteriales bacterium]
MKSALLYSTLLLVSSSFFACNQNDCDNGGDPNACPCYEIYAPVCGCDNVTYGNDCQAECAGITDYTVGACD